MLRLIGFLAMTAIGLSGFLTVDYSMSRQKTLADGGDTLTIEDYLDSLSDRIASVTTSAGTAGPTRALADMLPQAPKGWTVRPATGEDLEGFQPRNRREGTPEARKLVASLGSPKAAHGAEVVILTYENGDQRVVVKAERYPDAIFSDRRSFQRRFELETRSPAFRGLNFMTVRGLDVTEDILPDGMRGRLFMANVGGQIHLSLLAPKRMKDPDLLAFFQTLHVKAMNASVVNKEDGLGDVPVVVLASALGKAEYEAYQADRTARAAKKAARLEEDRKAYEALAMAGGQPAGDAPAAKAPVQDCVKGAGGIKRCTVGD